MKEKTELPEDQKQEECDTTSDKHSARSQGSAVSSHSSSQQQQSNNGTQKKKLGKYGNEEQPTGCFRLSPEEQEIAYELKASLMKDLDNQNAKIKTEIELHKRLKQIKKHERARTAHPGEKTEMSRQNAVKLMKLYEKNANRAEVRVKELEKDLEISQDLARRYHAMYLREKEHNDKNSGNGTSRSNEKSPSRDNGDQNKRPGSREGSVKSNQSESPREKKKNVTEDDLEDDEALYKRHIARLADTKSVKTTSPIRVTDVIRKSELVHIQNETLKREVNRLKYDNAQLIKQAKHSKEERDRVMHNLGTSEFARQDLQKRLEKEKTQHQKLQHSLTRQASEWIQHQKEAHEAEERRRWINVGAIAPYDSEGRAMHPVKKNVDRPRKMHPVENWDKSEEKT